MHLLVCDNQVNFQNARCNDKNNVSNTVPAEHELSYFAVNNKQRLWMWVVVKCVIWWACFNLLDMKAQECKKNIYDVYIA
jgi:hypothetical protein